MTSADQVMFVWIPRTGGTSIWSAVAQARLRCQRLTSDGQQLQSDTQCFTFQHKSLEYLKADWREHRPYIFTVVRNPWDRLVSVYHHLKAGRLQRARDVAEINGKGFKRFAEWATSDSVPSLHEGGAHFMQDYVCRQTEWFTIDGKATVDFVGRFESISETWKHICQRLNVRSRLPHTNRTQHRAYWDYYDEPLRRRVGEWYAEEIDIFRYSFEGK